MKIRSIRYCIGEGIQSVFRNKLMTLASVGIVAASLFMLGLFFTIIENINYNVEILQASPEIQAFVSTELSDEELNSLKEEIESNPKVAGCTLITREAAFEKAKEMFEDKQYLLEGLEDENPLRASFTVKTRDPGDGEIVVEYLKSLPGVEVVKYAYDLVKKLGDIATVIRLVSLALILMLAVISVFIVSNTIKLTVFSRRREISIMKYVGATDSFIRVPFFIEGIIIGLLGSAISFGLIYLLYDFCIGFVEENLPIIKLLSFEGVGAPLIIIYTVMGIILGGAGSSVSLRKYLRV